MAEIGQASPADFPAIDRLARLLYGDGVRPYAPVRQASRTFVAQEDQGVAGFVICTFSDYGITRSGQIDELAVAETSRGTGVGRQLLAVCEDWLRAEGVETIFVSLLSGAEGFYERFGFSPCIGPWFYLDLTRAERAPI